MSIIMKINRISPSNSTGLENRPDPGKKNPSGKAYLSKSSVTFDEYLEAQLKDRDFASHFKRAGQPGILIQKKSSTTIAEPSFSLSLNDIIPELHIPFHAYNAS